mgnify:CR=1 FL=1
MTDKIRRQAETEIVLLKEELRQQKDREDRMRPQINRRLKQKTDDFDKLYLERKQTEADYKRLGSEFDRQQEKLKEILKEVRTELAKKTEALVEEHTRAVATTELLEEAAKEKLELNKCHDDTHIMTRKDLNPRPCSTHVKSLTIVLILLYV